MVGSAGGDGRSKEAVGMMALHEALRNVCLNSDWAYSVFWTIRPRPRSRGGNVCKVGGDDNGSLMLMWEDGFCRTRAAECMEGTDVEDPVRKAFSKMSIQLYNYGEGVMGKVASDKCHKWVFKEPSQCEPNVSNHWQSSFDATIAVIQAGHGLLQLGSCKIIPEDLHFVLRMRHVFESLGHQSGFFLSRLFSSARNSSTSSVPTKQVPTPCPPPFFCWDHSSIHSASPITTPSVYQPPTHGGLPNDEDGTHLFLPRSSGAHFDGATTQHETDLRWPNGLSLFTALTGRADDAKLLFGSEETGNELPPQQLPLWIPGKNPASKSATTRYGNADETKAVPGAILGEDDTEDFLS
ncbi:unnamed protein product [Musa textilis]